MGLNEPLAAHVPASHPAGMFAVTEDEAATIRAVYEQRGEFAAAVELRRLFPRVLTTGRRGSACVPLPTGSRCLCCAR